MLFLWDQLSQCYPICFPWWGVWAKCALSWAGFTYSPPEHSPPTALPLPPPTLCLPAGQLLSVVPFAHSQLRGLLSGRPYTTSSLPVNIHQAATFEQLWEPHLFSGTFQLEGPPTTSITQAIQVGPAECWAGGSPPSPAGLGQREHKAGASITWLD